MAHIRPTTSLSGSAIVGKVVEDSPDPIRFGGIAAKIASDLEKHVEHEIRSCALGHIQRGGDTSAFDRVLSVRYGVAAADLIREKKFGNMVCLRESKMDCVSLEDVIGNAAVGNQRRVDPGGELVRAAKNLGISFGD
jgi:6-phosphofructokinase 1